MRAGATCGDCEWWSAYTSTDSLSGECRVNPPVVLEHEGTIETHWPVTTDLEWCGSYDRRGLVKDEDKAP